MDIILFVHKHKSVCTTVIVGFRAHRSMELSPFLAAREVEPRSARTATVQPRTNLFQVFPAIIQ